MSKSVDSRPDVTFFMPSLRGGGAERVMFDLAKGMAARGYTVDMVVLNRSGAVIDVSGSGVNVIDLERARAATALPALISYLRKRRPPVMLSTLEHTNVLAVVATKLVGGTRLVIREANTPSEDGARDGVKGLMVRLAMRVTYHGAATVVAVSQGVADSLSSVFGITPSRMQVIASPVITDRLRQGAGEAPTHSWFNDGGEPVVLAVGRLVEQKGFDTLIRAFAKARERVPSRLVIFGEGPLREELSALATSLGVADSVQLPGFERNPFAHMANCRLFVLSSRWEGLPNALIQALASGASVVSTDCPSGPREILDGGVHGALVPVDDTDRMAEALVAGLVSERAPLPEEWFSRYDAGLVISRYLAALGLPPYPTGTQAPADK